MTRRMSAGMETDDEVPDDDQARRDDAFAGHSAGPDGGYGGVRPEGIQQRHPEGYGRPEADVRRLQDPLVGRQAADVRWSVHGDQGSDRRLRADRDGLGSGGARNGAAVHGAAPRALAGVRM